ncbi:hypothetical protein ACWDG1_19460 [Streptomyces sp. NPDC001177]
MAAAAQPGVEAGAVEGAPVPQGDRMSPSCPAGDSAVDPRP